MFGSDLVGLAIGGALVLSLAGYLFYVLLHPDRF